MLCLLPFKTLKLLAILTNIKFKNLLNNYKFIPVLLMLFIQASYNVVNFSYSTVVFGIIISLLEICICAIIVVL